MHQTIITITITWSADPQGLAHDVAKMLCDEVIVAYGDEPDGRQDGWPGPFVEDVRYTTVRGSTAPVSDRPPGVEFFGYVENDDPMSLTDTEIGRRILGIDTP